MNDETRQPNPPDDNENRFNKLYQEHRRFVYRLLRLDLGESEAEDAAQEVWDRVSRNRESLREPDKFRSWLVVVTLNEARRRFRKNGWPHESIDELDNPDETPAADPCPAFIRDMDLERILRPLTGDQRELFELHCIQGYGLKEIAEMKGIKEASVRKRWSRAEKKLEKILDRYMNPE